MLSSSLLSSSTEACLNRFPTLEIPRATLGQASTLILEVQDGSLAPKHQRHWNPGNPRASGEFRKPTALGKISLGHRHSWTRDMIATLALKWANKELAALPLFLLLS